MRTCLCTLALLVTLTSSALAQTYVSSEVITVAGTSIGFTASAINPAATQAICRLETAEIRFRVDGTAPTASVGTVLSASDAVIVTGGNLLNGFRAIRTGGDSGSLTCTYANPPAPVPGVVIIPSGGSSATLSSILTALESTLNVNVTGVNGSTPLDAYTTATLQSAATANGNGSPLTVNGYGYVVLTVDCSTECTGGTTITLEGSEDGTIYKTLTQAIRLNGPGVGGVILNQDDTDESLWGAQIAGLQAVRAVISAYSAGTVTVTARAVISGQSNAMTDPCQGPKSWHLVNMSSATTVEIANAAIGKQWYLCSVNLSAHAAQTVAIGVDDTDGCGSITAGLHGGATAATGWSFAANGGIALGNGNGSVMRSATAGLYLCIITGQAAQLSGTISYVSAP